MALSVVYDPRYMTWDHWASLMVEAYGAQNLEIPGSEDEWKGWAVAVSYTHLTLPTNREV